VGLGALTAVVLAGCQSTLSRDTNRVHDQYDAELAKLKSKYEQDQAICESTANPTACKQELAAAYDENLKILWDLEQAEFQQTVDSAIRGRPATSSN
jgi:hypothetical protein